MKCRLYGLAGVLIYLSMSGCFKHREANIYFLEVGNQKLTFEKVHQKVSRRTITTADTMEISDTRSSWGSHTTTEEIIITDTTVFPKQTVYSKNTKTGYWSVISTKDSIYERDLLIDKDSLRKAITINHIFYDTIMFISPETLEEGFNVVKRNSIDILHDLGTMESKEITAIFSEPLLLDGAKDKIEIDTIWLLWINDSKLGVIKLSYPNPDKNNVTKLKELPNNSLVVFDVFHIKNKDLDVMTYYPRALIKVGE